MKYKRLQQLAILLLGLQLAACSSMNRTSDSSDAGVPAVSSEPASTALAEQTEAAETTGNIAPTPVTTDPADGSQPEEQQVKKQYKMNDVYRFVPINEDSPKKAVLLTFDDGPKDKEVITDMLDTLDKHEAKAIFFVNGYRVKQHPELLKLIYERGQTIGNHSWDHINLKNEDEATVEEQIDQLQTEIESLIGIKPKFFRPPYGSGGDKVKEIVKNHGMLYMTWSNGSLDWDASTKNKPDAVISNVMEQLHPGANILMHELQWTADALDELLAKLEAEGYSFINPEAIDISG